MFFASGFKARAIYRLRIIAFCGVSFFLDILKTSILSNFILHQFGGLHNLWDTPAFQGTPISVRKNNAILFHII